MPKHARVKRALQKIAHPRVREIQFVTGGFIYKQNTNHWIRIRGIHSSMKRFYKDPGKYALKNAHRKNAKKFFTTDEIQSMKEEVMHPKGQVGGTKVHKEIEMYCNERDEFDRCNEATKKYHAEKKAYKEAFKSKKAVRSPKKPSIMLHKYTIAVINELAAHDIIPIYSEYKIFSPGAYGTAIDIIGIDKNDKLCVIELKTGYLNTFRTWTRKMNGRLSRHLTNSKMSQAMLQAFIPACTLEYEYGVPATPYIITVNDRETRLIKVASSLMEERERIYPWIISEMKKT